MIQRLLGITLVLSLCTFAAPVLPAQPVIQPAADITKVPPAAQPSPHFDADAATEAYMAMMPPQPSPVRIPISKADTGSSSGTLSTAP